MKSDQIEFEDKWKAALKRAALSDACRVEFSKDVYSEAHSISYTLKSYCGDLKPIPDDRDYDLLKVFLMPLEKLAETISAERFKVSFDLKTGELQFCFL